MSVNRKKLSQATKIIVDELMKSDDVPADIADLYAEALRYFAASHRKQEKENRKLLRTLGPIVGLSYQKVGERFKVKG